MAEDATAAQAASSPGAIGNSLIPIVNRLHDIIAHLGNSSSADLHLPQVAVVGSQSSGKSSVLEALVGRDFLPRGSDICTRRPLVLQLVHRPRRADSPEGGEEWGEFLHIPGKRFFDFREIRREIQPFLFFGLEVLASEMLTCAETDKEAGENKGVSDKQIRLKIFSPNVLDITLVDLPGITKVPVGDQPSDIEARIRTMIFSYIKQKTCIILAVSPANADLANSDALQMARLADPDGSRTIGVITKLDIMDRGTDARNFLLGNIIPLRLGYVGVVNRSQQDINLNRSIKDALAFEENFFRNQPAYHGLSHCCGVPQLAKKLNQILVQHIRNVLPGLKSQINAELVTVAKEHASFGEVAESKEIDPCKDISDEDIRLAIQNATGPRSALFVPEVPFEVLVRRQIGRLLDPSLQCAKFIYDELRKMSHRCLAGELQRFPVLRRCMDEVIGNFLRDGLQPAETMITHIIEMEMDYINTSHPSFIGGSKAVENAQQLVKSVRLAAAASRVKDGTDSDKLQASEKKPRAVLARSSANGVVPDNQGARTIGDSERPGSSGGTTGTSWVSSIFGGVSEERAPPAKDVPLNKPYNMPVHSIESSLSMIQLREPPIILKPSENQTEQEALEIAITKLLLKSYYDIVRKNIEDSIPKAIMHFLVNHTKRELHNVFIRKLYREHLFEEMLREPDDIAARRKKCREKLRILQQVYKTLDEIPLEAESIEKGYTLDASESSLHGLPSSFYAGNNDLMSPYTASPKNPKSRKSHHSGEQPSAMYSSSDVNGLVSYPVVDA
ncbi:hypothetical protein ZIOFF_017425 [Zingiber officinale]|uniref:Dynamin-related protein 3A n=1 Tax=Zingiber officinale TaxID=94328 RepID=A0A8J5HBQ6_ZINOF|nr:hypothetical protein ZIOFF_017425 [Zingiber officinale]